MLRDVGDYIREQRRRAAVVRQLAEAAGVSNPYLSQIERGLRKPSAEILQQIAKALRISAETLYVQAGILDERERDERRVGAILADPSINERQKQVLLQIYESFRKENAARSATQAEPDPHTKENSDADHRSDAQVQGDRPGAGQGRARRGPQAVVRGGGRERPRLRSSCRPS